MHLLVAPTTRSLWSSDECGSELLFLIVLNTPRIKRLLQMLNFCFDDMNKLFILWIVAIVTTLELLQSYIKPPIWPVQSYPIAKDAFGGTFDASEEMLYLRKIGRLPPIPCKYVLT